MKATITLAINLPDGFTVRQFENFQMQLLSVVEKNKISLTKKIKTSFPKEYSVKPRNNK